ncbi:MAG: thioredoxin family protein [Bacillota bacterium]
MEIRVLGPGCANCNKLEAIVKEVVQEMGADATITKVTDIKEIVKSGVMLTPGLVIDGEVKMSGKLPSKSEVSQIIATALAK